MKKNDERKRRDIQTGRTTAKDDDDEEGFLYSKWMESYWRENCVMILLYSLPPSSSFPYSLPIILPNLECNPNIVNTNINNVRLESDRILVHPPRSDPFPLHAHHQTSSTSSPLITHHARAPRDGVQSPGAEWVWQEYTDQAHTGLASPATGHGSSVRTSAQQVEVFVVLCPRSGRGLHATIALLDGHTDRARVLPLLRPAQWDGREGGY